MTYADAPSLDVKRGHLKCVRADDIGSPRRTAVWRACLTVSDGYGVAQSDPGVRQIALTIKGLSVRGRLNLRGAPEPHVAAGPMRRAGHPLRQLEKIFAAVAEAIGK